MFDRDAGVIILLLTPQFNQSVDEGFHWDVLHKDLWKDSLQIVVNI